MKLCDKGHDEIVYDEYDIYNQGEFQGCPACELVEEVEEKDRQIMELEKQLDHERTKDEKAT